jgi:hypothetical protein
MYSEDRKLAGALALAVKELLAEAERLSYKTSHINTSDNPYANAKECLEWFESIPRHRQLGAPMNTAIQQPDHGNPLKFKWTPAEFVELKQLIALRDEAHKAYRIASLKIKGLEAVASIRAIEEQS